MKTKFNIGDKLIYCDKEDFEEYCGFFPIRRLIVSKIEINKGFIYYCDEELRTGAFEEELVLLTNDNVENMIKNMSENIQYIAKKRIEGLPNEIRSLLKEENEDGK